MFGEFGRDFNQKQGFWQTEAEGRFKWIRLFATKKSYWTVFSWFESISSDRQARSNDMMMTVKEEQKWNIITTQEEEQRSRRQILNWREKWLKSRASVSTSFRESVYFDSFSQRFDSKAFLRQDISVCLWHFPLSLWHLPVTSSLLLLFQRWRRWWSFL